MPEIVGNLLSCNKDGLVIKDDEDDDIEVSFEGMSAPTVAYVLAQCEALAGRRVTYYYDTRGSRLAQVPDGPGGLLLNRVDPVTGRWSKQTFGTVSLPDEELH